MKSWNGLLSLPTLGFLALLTVLPSPTSASRCYASLNGSAFCNIRDSCDSCEEANNGWILVDPWGNPVPQYVCGEALFDGVCSCDELTGCGSRCYFLDPCMWADGRGPCDWSAPKAARVALKTPTRLGPSSKPIVLRLGE